VYELRKELTAKLNVILSEEEVKWRQRSKEDLLEGYRNTKYFMLKASGRKRRNIFLDSYKMKV
jgi:hypothetical protein